MARNNCKQKVDRKNCKIVTTVIQITVVEAYRRSRSTVVLRF